MRRVTRLLLVASVAVTGLTGVNACSDDVTVVEPPPPPPPPEPPRDLPSVVITAVRDFETGADVLDESVVEGKLIVFVDIAQGNDAQFDQLDITVDGEVALNCQNFTGSASVGESGQAGIVLECILNTAAIEDDECVGQVATGQFENGDHIIGARLTLTDGSTVSAERGFPVEFDNPNTLIVEHLGGGQGILGPMGRTYWGGPTDKVPDDEDPEDNLVQFAVCPVLFDTAIDVAEVRIAGETTAGPQDVDLTGGPGALAADDEEPFVFGAESSVNAGVEDDPAGDGHTIGSAFQVLNANGADVSAQFAIQALEMFFLDFTGPTIGAAAEIFIDGVSVVTNGLYSAGTFTLNDVSDAGVGFTQDGVILEVHDAADPASIEAEDAESIDDLSEDDGTVDADGNEFDAYEGEVVDLMDLLMNSTDPAPIPVTDPFGVDRTEAEISNLQPETSPDDDPPFVLNDVAIMFDAVDPDLESGDPGSGVDETGCAGGGPCTEISASADGTDLPVDDAGTDNATNPDYNVDITGLADGEYEVSLTVPDLAVLSPNVATGAFFNFILDTTAPDVSFAGVTGLDESNASSVELTVSGTVVDRNMDASAVTSAVMFVTLAGPNDVCDDPDPASGSDDIYDPAAVGVTPDETTGDGVVDIDLLDQIQANAGDYEAMFSASNLEDLGTEPAAEPSTSKYCFWMVADDGALLKDGTDDGVASAAFASKVFNWNP